ncbi:hypothetical protein GWK47_008995 [Chionoecetes opilio]|uniref:Uncharacterized protein n=1 Tax=Chionoecetes opilio TaxID=41210 RepID=A0A8J4Y5P8_CHIOP|nr:hypothetical protein GWK47_008995 [Chionoecetes opilio]
MLVEVEDNMGWRQTRQDGMVVAAHDLSSQGALTDRFRYKLYVLSRISWLFVYVVKIYYFLPPLTNHPATNPPANNHLATNHTAINPLATNHAAINPLATNHAAINPLATNHTATNPELTGGTTNKSPSQTYESGVATMTSYYCVAYWSKGNTHMESVSHTSLASPPYGIPRYIPNLGDSSEEEQRSNSDEGSYEFDLDDYFYDFDEDSGEDTDDRTTFLDFPVQKPGWSIHPFFPKVPTADDFPDDYDNATHTVHVLNGTRVEVNTTTNKDTDDSITTFFHTKIPVVEETIPEIPVYDHNVLSELVLEEVSNP